jgi:type I restriction enzyme S subunit
MEHYPFPFPPLPEQQRIAEKLESLLGKIKEAKALLDEIPEILQSFRQTVLAAACSGRLTEDWRQMNRNIEPASELLRKIDSDMDQTNRRTELQRKNVVGFYTAPAKWIWRSFSDICVKIFDGTHFSPKNGPVGDFMYVTAKNIKPWGIDLADITYVSKEDHQRIHSRSDVKYRDVLYIKDGATAGIAAVNYFKDEFSLLSSVGVFRVNPEYILPEYVSIFLNAPSTRAAMLANVTGVAITRLTLTKLNASSICLPPFLEQQEIVRRVEFLFRKADEFEAQYKKAMELIETLPEIILSKAFRGELVPQNPSDEPASAILDRIIGEERVSRGKRVQ